MGDFLALLLALLAARQDQCHVLDWLDARRAYAYTAADVSELESIYVPGPELDAEREQLESWTARGIRLRGARMERDSCAVVGDELVVRERLGTTTAVFANGVQRQLPADDWSERRIRLQFSSGRWLITAVSG